MQKRILILLLLLCLPLASAAQLGMNYYHESMISGQWGTHYIHRTSEQAAQDFKHIDSITDHVKLYMNPFAEGNQEWVLELSDLARAQGLHVAVTMNVEDRILDWSNWDSYRSLVLEGCRAFEGRADTFLVGNEIALHTTFSDEEIRRLAEELINDCRQEYSGLVSYEAFWWSSHAWAGYDDIIFVHHYEGIDTFRNNVWTMDQRWGPNAIVGEFGDDFYDESILRAHEFQDASVSERWNILQESQTPLAYVFTYREPSWTGFGLLDPDGTERPAWKSLAQHAPTDDEVLVDEEPVENPVDDTPEEQAPEESTPDQESAVTEGSLAELSFRVHGDATITQDYLSNDCRSFVLDSSQGEFHARACPTSETQAEFYTWDAPHVPFELCLGRDCISDLGRYTTLSFSSGHAAADAARQDIRDLVVTSSSEAVNDYVEKSSCRRVEFNSPGWTAVRICDKGHQFEMYRISSESPVEVCVQDACVGGLRGFAAIPNSA